LQTLANKKIVKRLIITTHAHPGNDSFWCIIKKDLFGQDNMELLDYGVTFVWGHNHENQYIPIDCDKETAAEGTPSSKNMVKGKNEKKGYGKGNPKDHEENADPKTTNMINGFGLSGYGMPDRRDLKEDYCDPRWSDEEGYLHDDKDPKKKVGMDSADPRNESEGYNLWKPNGSAYPSQHKSYTHYSHTKHYKSGHKQHKNYHDSDL
jgi:hypothetical protein